MWFDWSTAKSLVRGLASICPIIYHLLPVRTGSNVNMARYCYAVWLRHLIKAHEAGMTNVPVTVAELGPGESLGVGLAALITGCEKYLAFDIVSFADLKDHQPLFDELVELFLSNAIMPSDEEFPKLYPKVAFIVQPQNIFGKKHWYHALASERIQQLRNRLFVDVSDCPISYVVPWTGKDQVQPCSVDLILSHAVLEYIENLSDTHRILFSWLKPGGFASHQIDLSAHQTANRWNGHLTYPSFVWRLMRGCQPYWLNRFTCGYHLENITNVGFCIRRFDSVRRNSDVRRKELASNFQEMSDDDLCVANAFIQVQKPIKIFN